MTSPEDRAVGPSATAPMQLPCSALLEGGAAIGAIEDLRGRVSIMILRKRKCVDSRLTLYPPDRDVLTTVLAEARRQSSIAAAPGDSLSDGVQRAVRDRSLRAAALVKVVNDLLRKVPTQHDQGRSRQGTRVGSLDEMLLLFSALSAASSSRSSSPRQPPMMFPQLPGSSVQLAPAASTSSSYSTLLCTDSCVSAAAASAPTSSSPAPSSAGAASDSDGVSSQGSPRRDLLDDPAVPDVVRAHIEAMEMRIEALELLVCQQSQRPAVPTPAPAPVTPPLSQTASAVSVPPSSCEPSSMSLPSRSPSPVRNVADAAAQQLSRDQAAELLRGLAQPAPAPESRRTVVLAPQHQHQQRASADASLTVPDPCSTPAPAALAPTASTSPSPPSSSSSATAATASAAAASQGGSGSCAGGSGNALYRVLRAVTTGDAALRVSSMLAQHSSAIEVHRACETVRHVLRRTSGRLDGVHQFMQLVLVQMNGDRFVTPHRLADALVMLERCLGISDVMLLSPEFLVNQAQRLPKGASRKAYDTAHGTIDVVRLLNGAKAMMREIQHAYSRAKVKTALQQQAPVATGRDPMRTGSKRSAAAAELPDGDAPSASRIKLEQ